ncbi:hypothetical protein HMPREF9466_00347 [Fusobacterium necrophorum subsp. funduliforme 1_1_36S]|nr:hypothetical protein HMPREF9466_00347 [Fusobacterium necrophorum subsp. funduliforme 1_1_36S]
MTPIEKACYNIEKILKGFSYEKILFYLDSLLLGGEQKIAIDYLNVLQPHYQVSLLVNMDFGEDNFFLSQIPKEIPISFVIEKELLLSLNYYKKNRRNSLKNRILYSWYLTKNERQDRKNRSYLAIS